MRRTPSPSHRRVAVRCTFALAVLLVTPLACLLPSTPAAAQSWTFTDVTTSAGVSFSHADVDTGRFDEIRLVAGGAAAGDYDADGWLDVYAVGGNAGRNRLFRNRGDGSFEEVAEAAGVALAGTSSSGPSFADYDGDGDLDLFVGAAEGAEAHLFRNRGDGTFEDVTEAAELSFTRPAISASFGDYDRDGDLDLAVSHWASSLADGSKEHLWRNDGDGTFTDVSELRGIVLEESPAIPGLVFTFAPTFADLDGDGWPELLYSSDFHVSQVFHNDQGTFRDVTTAVISDENGMGSAVADYDGDGDLDWFVSSIWDPTAITDPHVGKTGNRLYRNLGDGSFEDATDEAGVREGDWGWGSTFADLNNDGHLDLFHVNGFGLIQYHGPTWLPFMEDPARLFVSDGDGTFTESGASLGVADRGSGRGVVAFDYDRDGDVDLFVANSNGPTRLFRNDGGNERNHLAFRLRGRAPNTSAIGARIYVTAGGKRQMRELRAGSNYVSQDPIEAHFGLGAADVATEIEIVWPDGKHRFLGRTRANQLLVVDQPASSVDEQSKDQRKCIVALHRGGAKIAAAVTRRFERCVEDAGAGKLPLGESVSQCLERDPKNAIAKAEQSAEKTAAKACVRTPAYGPKTASEVAEAMLSVLRVADVFGPSLDEALIDGSDDPEGAVCQSSIAAHLGSLVRLRIAEFETCVKKALEDGTIRSAEDLQACIGADPRGKLARKVEALARVARQKCGDTAIATAFPGKCADAASDDFASCLADQADCGVCSALNEADGSSADCHRFTDGVSEGSDYCGDEPVEEHSIARVWNEELMNAIRKDTPRPTVHSRNLFHLSAAMWDAWRAYGGGGSAFLTDEIHASGDPARDREIAISFAAYRILASRFANSVGRAVSLPAIRKRMYDLGFDVDFAPTTGDAPAEVGNRIAAAMIAFGLADGSNEQGDYADPSYQPVNPPLVVKQSGTTVVDPNRWQPLALDLIVTQNGIPLPDKVQGAIGVRWNGVVPFALTREDENDVYVDPGPPPQLGGADDAGYKEGGRQVVELSSFLDPFDGVMIDRSPGSMGNNPLGSNAGTGHALNPATGLPYEPNLVPRGDWGRVLAEYWADGPSSETPPGHWNVIANEVSDDPRIEHRLGGTGPVLDRLEWDVKLYFTLNGAVHDAAIVAWGLKRKYDSVRPITMIRHMGGLGQSSEPLGPSYDPDGLPLQPGVIEVITGESSAPGERHEALAAHVGEIAVRTWAGPVADPKTQTAGAAWRRAVDWIPYQAKTFVTPAFPGFTSGHSTFSRSAAEVMTHFTGSAFFPGGLGKFVAHQNQYLTFERGPSVEVELQWATYYDAADLAGQSRLWGGIHVSPDDFQGRITGSSIGNGAFDLAMEYFEGNVGP
ncbi:MAG: hypothetical protein FJ144_19770 [Deltaproteobacteria bacterium]|nr:hypothetical protein [Deltaproteobacteria bacterium]